MNKKLLTTISIIAFSFILGISYSFAANNMASDAVQGVRNVVGGAENVVEGAASGVANGVKNVTGATENTMNSATGAVARDGNNGNYTATRTSTRANGTVSFMGLSATGWTWLIMAAFGIITIGLVWYYGKQFENKYESDIED